MSKQSSNQTLLIILLAVGGVFLLCFAICVCGGIIAFRSAAQQGIEAAKTTQTRIEVELMTDALEVYRLDRSAFPPNFDDRDFLIRHMRIAFPRFSPASEGATPLPDDLDPAEVLVFWLRGFGPNPADPLAGPRHQPLFDFDRSRLRDADGDGNHEYYPISADVPFVYFHHRSYATAQYDPPSGFQGMARPYRSDEAGSEFVNADSFQIISAGADNHFGQGGSFPSGDGYAAEDEDNVTNFSEMTLGEDRDLSGG